MRTVTDGEYGLNALTRLSTRSIGRSRCMDQARSGLMHNNFVIDYVPWTGPTNVTTALQ